MNLKNPEESLRYLGNPLQMYGVERMLTDEGKAKGSTVYQVRTGGGLEYEVLADNGLDLGRLHYKGINIHYLTKNGQQSPYAFHPFEGDFVHTFPAGMMYTCGLMSTGGANRDDGIWHPAHGRFHSIPAIQCGSRVYDCEKIEVSGLVRETQFSGHVLAVERTISSPVGGKSLVITDKMTNCTPALTEYMFLYHINFGYPFLSPELIMQLPENSVSKPRDDISAKGMAERFAFTAPVDGKPEELFFHDIPSDNKKASLKLVNNQLGFGVEISWSADTLPICAHWKCMRSGEYVLGIEPTNSYIMGRNEEKKNGTIGVIKPFETKTMHMELNFFDL